MFELQAAAINIVVNLIPMKTRIVILMIIASIAIQSCHKAMTPYEAANHPRGKKCRDIK